MNEFVYVSGRHCLDFAGTILWRRTLRTELLETPADLQRWVTGAHLCDEMEPPSTDDVHDALRLREAIYGAVGAALTGSTPRATEAEVGLLNTAAAGPLPTLTLTREGHTTSTGTPGNTLSLLARDAIELIGSPEMAKVKECSNPDCTRLFVDLSRGFSRRWCGMAECGNRIKAADYRRRKKLQNIE
ncbi:CGNR zinc finger domain-containing protein [Rhodococcus koreensis]